MARVLLRGAQMLEGQVLSDFRSTRPRFESRQAVALEWILQAHVGAERTLTAASDDSLAEFTHRLTKLVRRCACNPSQIGSRGHVLEDASAIYDVENHPRGKGMLARMEIYEHEVNRYFEETYENCASPPSDIIHVTCTGYVSPSGAQALVAQRGWGEKARVTHAYHMGCYAAIPALRIAEGCLRSSASASPRADVVHTELCTLHLDPSRHDPEQLVVQSLFGDGFIRYAIEGDSRQPGLKLIVANERIVPDSGQSMRWVISEWGMQMTLARDVPAKVGAVLRPFVADLLARADVALGELPKTQFAVHPGGPRIIDGVRESLELDESQVRISRGVLFDYGNMSSATLPHVWKRMLESDDIARGTVIVSLAFGPGVTVSGAVFRKQ